mgnify:CR=1 FL=1
MKKYLLSLILMVPLSVFVVAQDSESEDVEEVVVTGIKSSLKDAIEIKRNNVYSANRMGLPRKFS